MIRLKFPRDLIWHAFEAVAILATARATILAMFRAADRKVCASAANPDEPEEA